VFGTLKMESNSAFIRDTWGRCGILIFLVFRIDSDDSKLLLTGSGDSSCRLWEVESGKELFLWKTKTAVRAVAFALGDEKALFVSDATMGEVCVIHIVSVTTRSAARLLEIRVTDSKVTTAVWGPYNTHIITGHENGTISLWDSTSGDLVNSVQLQSGVIQDIQFGKARNYFIAASKDHSAVVYDSHTLEEFKRFVTERPCNAAVISPIKPHVSKRNVDSVRRRARCHERYNHLCQTRKV
jgi:translation initiation factor 3 subunit I